MGIGVAEIVTGFPERVRVGNAHVDEVREFCLKQFGEDRLADPDGIWLMIPHRSGVMAFYFKSVADVLVLRLRFAELRWQ